MTAPAKPQPAPESADNAAPAGQGQSSIVKRICFVADRAPAGKVRRTFRRPRPCVAVEEVVQLSDLPSPPVPGATESVADSTIPPSADFYVVFVTTGSRRQGAEAQPSLAGAPGSA